MSMSESPFIPKMKHVVVEETQEQVNYVVNPVNNKNSILKIVQYLTIAIFGLLPVFFTPHLWASLNFDKVMMMIGLGSVAVILLAFQSLRQTYVNTILPATIGFFGLLILTAIISAYSSTDIQIAFRGSFIETQTVLFLLLMILAMSLPLVFQGTKAMTLKALTFFGLTAFLLIVYNIVRVFTGAGFLPFSSFGAVTISPIGVFNDMAIFCGLVIVFSLVTLVYLPLKNSLQYILFAFINLSLLMLMIINFFNVWIVIGLFSLLLLIYLATKDTIFQTEEKVVIKKTKIPLIATAVVFSVCVLFLLAGNYLGGQISQITNINHIEVKPSLLAMLQLTKAVYSENILLGVGPNHFDSAWRLHKDSSINETFFWDTDFVAGSGFVPTLFITLGLIGGILMILTHLSFLYLGYKMLLKPKRTDSYWYYFGVVTFASAVFLWIMAYIYVPGAALLLLTAFFTGLTFVAASGLLPNSIKTVPLVSSRRRGFLMMSLVIILVIGTLSATFSAGKQYLAQTIFTKAITNSVSVIDLEEKSLRAYNLYNDNRFLAAVLEVKLVELNRLLSIPESTPESTQEIAQQFSNLSNQAVELANRLLSNNPNNPKYQVMTAGTYSILALIGVNEAQARSELALNNARKLDPVNPIYDLVSAQLSLRIGDSDKAREYIESALRLKRNYTDAMFLLTQLDIQSGELESAIATARNMIALEPNNPVRYFQIGVLLSANENVAEAEIAFKTAIELDSQYANARYLLGFLYLNTNRQAQALEQFRLVQLTNPENTELDNIIKQVDSGDYENIQNINLSNQVNEPAPMSDFENRVITDSDTDTNLVTPVNTVINNQSDDRLSPSSVTNENETVDMDSETQTENLAPSDLEVVGEVENE